MGWNWNWNGNLLYLLNILYIYIYIYLHPKKKDEEYAKLPVEVHSYHSLCPLEPSHRPDKTSKSFGIHSTVYKAVSKTDGKSYILRRLEGERERGRCVCVNNYRERDASITQRDLSIKLNVYVCEL